MCGNIVLLVVAHPDDELIWFYRSIRYYQNHGFKILLYCFRIDNSVRFGELRNSCRQNNIYLTNDVSCNSYNFDACSFAKVIEKEKPKIILTHSPWGNASFHREHRKCWEISNAFCRNKHIHLSHTILVDQNSVLFKSDRSSKYYYLAFNEMTSSGLSRQFRSKIRAFFLMVLSIIKYRHSNILMLGSGATGLYKAFHLYNSQNLSGYTPLSDKIEYLVELDL